MKNIFYFGLISLGFNTVAQTPIGNPPSSYATNPNQAITNSNFAWYRGGNNPGGPAGVNNIFGTMWNSPVYHYTAGQQRMVLFGNAINPSTPNGGGLGISLIPSNPITVPKALLTIGVDYDPIGITNSGWRPWMKVGTFNTDGSDQAYFGLKNEGALDRNDAVIVWGDDNGNPISPDIFSPDYMRFIFSADHGNGTNSATGQGNHGLEVARFSPFGRMGIGNYYNSPLFTITKEPARQLEILSDKQSDNINGNPIFRLTHTQQSMLNPSNTGKYCEFEPRNNGDLFIAMLDNTQTNNNTHNLKERFVGININTPGNTLEINSQLVNANTSNGNTGIPTGNATGWAGLRFTDLNSTSITQANPGLGVLAVDKFGDVIYVPAGGGTNDPFGAACNSAVPYNLPTNWKVGMNGFNLNFNGLGNINIGDIGGCFPGNPGIARVFVRNTFNNGNIPNNALYVAGFGAGANGQYAIQTSGDVNINGIGYCGAQIFAGSDKNIKDNIQNIKSSLEIVSKLKPVSFTYNNQNAPQMNVDGNSFGFIAQEVEQVLPELVKEMKVIGRIDSTGTPIDSTVTLKALNYSGLIPFAIGGIQELNAKQKEMQAQLDKAGLSDVQVKTNINNFNALAKIKSLNPVQYNFTNQNVPQLTFKNNLDYGFVAQQLETVYPELIDTVNIEATYDSLGNVVNQAKTLKTVNYKAMAALLVRSIQEQQSKIDSLTTMLNTKDSVQDARLTALEEAINRCCTNNTTRTSNNSAQKTINSLDVELSDKDAIVLNQNVPNPFAEQTTITYNVPASVEKAQIIFYNANGQIIQTVEIKTRGKGKVNVFAADLSSGLYHYTLVADGKVVDSKKMVRE